MGCGCKQAVDAVANPEAVRLRLDVHVAGSRLDRFEQDFVDQPNDAGLLRHFGKFGAVGFDFAEQFDVVVGLRQPGC